MLRLTSIGVAVIILAAVSHATVIIQGGYGQPGAYVVLALAAGIALGAVAIGRAWSIDRRGISVALTVALAAGEGYGIISTAERAIAAREALQAPLREAMERHTAALSRLVRAETSSKISDAQAARADTARQVLLVSAEKSCREGCIKTQQDLLASATRAVDEAKSEALREIELARANLERHPLPPSGSPLADRLGVAPWTVDITAAILASLGANGLAAALLAFGAHGHGYTPSPVEPVRRSPARQPLPLVDVPQLEAPAPEPTDLEAFMSECLTFHPSRVVPAVRIYDRYRTWCSENVAEPLTAREFVPAFKAECEARGIKTTKQNGQVMCQGVTLSG